MQTLLTHPRDGYPWRLFAASYSDDCARSVWQDWQYAPCLFCQWSRKFMHDYGATVLDSRSNARAELELLVAVAHEDIAQLEAKHDAIRRNMKLNVQSKTMSLVDLSARFLARTVRTWTKEFEGVASSGKRG